MKKYIKNIIIFALILLIISNVNIITAKASTITNNRIGGVNRYQTSAKIAEADVKTTSDYAIIVTGQDYADALCSATLAKKYNAPILLTETLNLNNYAKSELKRLNVKNVIIIGGYGAVSKNTEAQIKELNIRTSRISGINRYDTSEKIAENIGTCSSAVVATGEDFPDALSIASIAAANNMPILLTNKNEISSNVKNYLNNSNISKVYVIGGTGVISDNVLSCLKNTERLCGKNRYETNITILNKFKNNLNLSNIYISTGMDYPDALSCSILAANSKSPVVLLDNEPDSMTKTYLNSNINSINNVIAIGGNGVISDALIQSTINFYNTSISEFTVQDKTNFRTFINNFYIGDQKLLTAKATSLNGLKYKFCVKDLSTGENRIIQDYSNNNTAVFTAFYGGNYQLSVYARDSSSIDAYEDVQTSNINVVQIADDYGRNQSLLEKNLIFYLLSSKENRDSVMKRAIELHGGITNNTCVYFTSEALRRAGASFIPDEICNTHQLTDKLKNNGWIKNSDYTRLLPGDLCFTINGGDGYPTHVYTFIDWVNKGDYKWAYVIDNQDYNDAGDNYHIRIISVKNDRFDKFQYSMHINNG